MRRPIAEKLRELEVGGGTDLYPRPRGGAPRHAQGAGEGEAPDRALRRPHRGREELRCPGRAHRRRRHHDHHRGHGRGLRPRADGAARGARQGPLLPHRRSRQRAAHLHQRDPGDHAGPGGGGKHPAAAGPGGRADRGLRRGRVSGSRRLPAHLRQARRAGAARRTRRRSRCSRRGATAWARRWRSPPISPAAGAGAGSSGRTSGASSRRWPAGPCAAAGASPSCPDSSGTDSAAR